MPQISSTFKIVIISLMILSGAINTIAYKFQNQQMVYEGQYHKYFFHPYMQATAMFVGEALVLAVYFVMKKRDEEGFRMRSLQAKSSGKQLDFNVFWLAVPAFVDLIMTTLHYFALNFVTGSIYQMTRGGTIITTFMFSTLILKTKAKRNQIAGCVLAVIGVVIVGIASFVFSSDGQSQKDATLQIVGFFLVVAALFANGFFFVFQEKLLSKYHIQPLQMVGYEGVFGLAMELILLTIVSFLPCNFGIQACVISSQGMPFVEIPSAYFHQVGQDGWLLAVCFFGILSLAIFNITGVNVTKHINSLARSICDVTRTVVIWIVGIVVTVTAGTNRPNYKWELINGVAISIQLIGFAILILGNLIYNRIIVFSIFRPQQFINPLLESEVEHEHSQISTVDANSQS